MNNDQYAVIKSQGGPFDDLIKQSADTHGVSYELLHKQLFMESSFNPAAVSPTGPRGLGQFTRATGRAYGLVNDEDFFDPAKSIEAAARHMKDNLRAAGGDELKALLIYNQGAGRLGRPQLEAYDRGDLNGVSEEGRNYLKNMLDVAQTGNKEPFMKYTSPKTPSGFEAPAGLSDETSGAQPWASPYTGTSLEFEGKDVPGKATSFAENLMETTGRTEDTDGKGIFEGTGQAIKDEMKMSPLGVAIRAASINDEADFSETISMLLDLINDPLDKGVMEDWTEDDFDKVRSSGLDPQFYDVVLRGRKENFESNLALAKQNQELARETAQAGLGAQIVGGAASIAGDPWTLVNPARGAGASIAGRLAGGAVAGAALGGLSESTSARISGREEHLGMAIAGGAAFGGLINGLLGPRLGSLGPNKEGAQRGYSEDWINDAGMRGDIDDEMLESILSRHGEAGRQNRMIEWDDDMLPTESRLFDMDERGPQADGNNATLEDILARHGEASEANTFAGDFMRLEAREKARLAGEEEDPTRMPYNDDDVWHEDGAVPYMDVPFDPSAVRLPDGTILSGGSPMNPKTLKEFREFSEPDTNPKAVMGARLGTITEIGLKLGRSNNEDIRGVARGLFRSSTGYQDGSNGKYAATSSDIIERLRAQDNVAHNKLKGLIDTALDDPYWRTQGMSNEAKLEALSRKVVEHMEAATHGTPTSRLTASEKALMDTLRGHMEKKWSYIDNPGQFGNMDARSLLDSTNHAGTYYPVRYSSAAKHAMIQRLGSPEELQEAIASSMLSSYAARPTVRARVDKMILDKMKAEGIEKPTPKAIREAVEKYARDKAYGISHTDQFHRSSILEDNLRDGVGVENNSYLEARHLFDSDMKVTLPDGTGFALNDLREFNAMRVVPQYDRRVNGDVALMGGTGKSTAELRELATKLHQKASPDALSEAKALMDALKLFTGRSRRNDIENGFETMLRSMMDVGFMTKNAFMGVQNFTEMASLVVKGHLKMLTHGIPVLKRLTTAGTKLSPDDIKTLHGTVFGKEIDDLIRPTRQDIIDKLRESDGFGSGGVSSAVIGTIKHTTGELSARSPFTYILRETSNYLMDAGRQGVIADLADNVLNGTQGKLFTPERLRSASITDAQMDGIKDLIKAHFKRDNKGKWSLQDPEGLASDPRSMDLWRLGDRVADETILRPHKMSLQTSKQVSAYLAAPLQFKMFVLRSLNARVVRGWMEATKNRQVLDQVMQSIVSIGLATGFYAGQQQLKAYGLPDRERQDYLKRSLNLEHLAYAALSRSSHLGSPVGVAGYIAAPLGYDPAAAVRTSILPRGAKEERPDRPIKWGPLSSPAVQDGVSGLAEQVPSMNVPGSIFQVAHSAAHLAADGRGMDAQGYRTGLWNGLKHFVPNDPLSQNLMLRLAEAHGVDRSR